MCTHEITLVCSESVAAESMFKPLLLAVERIDYRKGVQKRLKDVEHENYIDIAVNGYQEACTQTVKNLQRNGVPLTDRVKAPIGHLNCQIHAWLSCLHGEWRKGLSSSKKGAVINSGRAKMFPWEDLCYEVVFI